MIDEAALVQFLCWHQELLDSDGVHIANCSYLKSLPHPKDARSAWSNVALPTND